MSNSVGDAIKIIQAMATYVCVKESWNIDTYEMK